MPCRLVHSTEYSHSDRATPPRTTGAYTFFLFALHGEYFKEFVQEILKPSTAYLGVASMAGWPHFSHIHLEIYGIIANSNTLGTTAGDVNQIKKLELARLLYGYRRG